MSKYSEGPWFVYIILCENGRLYTGITKNVQKRFDTHKSGKGAKYTKANKPLKVVCVWPLPARRFENCFVTEGSFRVSEEEKHNQVINGS